MNKFTSPAFLQSISAYTKTSKTIQHPVYGDFSLYKDNEGLMLLKKTMSEDQFARIDVDAFEHYNSLDSPYILQFKGFVKENRGDHDVYAMFYEHFEETLKDEIERKAHNKIRYTPEEVLHILQSASRALAHMQAMRLVHGEVKSTNIVRVGKDYKLVNPAVFGQSLPHFDITIPRYPIRTTKIISTELRNAMYRDIVDPVHEDLKDDVYALGLVALDIMILRVEAPIPVEKRLERSNVIYSNTLLRLVKKMLESVLTLRLDPIACKLYIEKIYYKVAQETFSANVQQNVSVVDSKAHTPEKIANLSPLLSETKGQYRTISEPPTSQDRSTSTRRDTVQYVSNSMTDFLSSGDRARARESQYVPAEEGKELNFLQLYEEFMSTKNDKSMLAARGRRNTDLSTTYNSRPPVQGSLTESKFNTWDISRMSGDVVDVNGSISQQENSELCNPEADNTPRFRGNRQNFGGFEAARRATPKQELKRAMMSDEDVSRVLRTEELENEEDSSVLREKDVNIYSQPEKNAAIKANLQLQAKDKENKTSESMNALNSTKDTSIGDLSKTSYRIKPVCDAESISIEKCLDIQVIYSQSEKELPRAYSVQLDQQILRHGTSYNYTERQSRTFRNSFDLSQDQNDSKILPSPRILLQPNLTDSYIIGSNPEIDARLLQFLNTQTNDSGIQSSKKITERMDDGTVYEGEMTRFLRNGSGKLTYPDGKCFVGQFSNGKIHGEGVMYNADGSIICQGEWQNDKFIN